LDIFYFIFQFPIHCTENKGCYDRKGNAALKAFIVGIKVNGKATREFYFPRPTAVFYVKFSQMCKAPISCLHFAI